ncbi:MAG: hypothetical protein LC721_00705 [Actinobacteria bacterium]|nr:hypothetical protein [Actinomycetota bacterium]
MDILLTAAITSAFALTVALWRLGLTGPDILAITVLSGARCCCGGCRRICPRSTTTDCPAFPPATGPPQCGPLFLSLFAELRVTTDPATTTGTRVLAVNVITI